MKKRKSLFLCPSIMRGSHKLRNVDKIVYADTQGALFTVEERNHYSEKVRAIAARYHYYKEYLGIRKYDELLSKLQWEFFLQPRRIAEIIDENIAVLETIKTEATSKKYFIEKWPHMAW